jgi:hypothetical protein
MMPKTAFVTGKTIKKNVDYSNFSRQASSRHILPAIIGTASHVLSYAPIVKKQCLINFDASLPPKKKGYSLICNPLISMVGGTGIEPVTAAG